MFLFYERFCPTTITLFLLLCIQLSYFSVVFVMLNFWYHIYMFVSRCGPNVVLYLQDSESLNRGILFELCSCKCIAEIFIVFELNVVVLQMKNIGYWWSHSLEIIYFFYTDGILDVRCSSDMSHIISEVSLHAGGRNHYPWRKIK